MVKSLTSENILILTKNTFGFKLVKNNNKQTFDLFSDFIKSEIQPLEDNSVSFEKKTLESQITLKEDYISKFKINRAEELKIHELEMILQKRKDELSLDIEKEIKKQNLPEDKKRFEELILLESKVNLNINSKILSFLSSFSLSTKKIILKLAFENNLISEVRYKSLSI